MKAKIIGAAIAAAVMSSAALAQSFNIDMNAATGAGAGNPSSAFGGAANQAGFWNNITSISANAPIALAGLDGAATSATLTSNATLTSFFSSTTNGTLASAPVDMQRLLADIVDLGGSTTVPRVFTFSGLQNGIYDVYTYAMAPDGATFISRVNVNAPATAGTPGAQSVGGTFAGSFQQGITHAFHQSIAVTDGTLTVNILAQTSFMSLAGFQIVIPGPGGLAFIGLAGLIGSRRRRA